MALEVLYYTMDEVAQSPVCTKEMDTSVDFVRCNGKCENILHISCPLNTDVYPVPIFPDMRDTWKCTECAESASVQRADLKPADDFLSPEEVPNLPAPKICDVCNETVKNPFDSLQCFTCKEVYHYRCVGYSSEEEFDAVTEDMKMQWKCSKCFATDLVCGLCEESAAENPFDILGCRECQQVYHYTCVGFTLERFDELSEDKTNWLCQKCQP